MRIAHALRCAALAAAALAACGVRAEEPFDACQVFTQADAEKALGTAAAAEPVNPKVRRPKVVTTCTYNGVKDGKPVAATVAFRFGRTEPEARDAFEAARLDQQTKPMLLDGTDAFWSARTGQLNLRKGRTWLVITVGSAKPGDRDDDDAKKLALILARKI